MDRKELLRAIVTDTVNGDKASAAANFHDYLQQAMRAAIDAKKSDESDE